MLAAGISGRSIVGSSPSVISSNSASSFGSSAAFRRSVQGQNRNSFVKILVTNPFRGVVWVGLVDIHLDFRELLLAR